MEQAGSSSFRAGSQRSAREKGAQKQLEFLLELLQAELTLRDENRRKRLIKRAGFPTYKTFEGYSYHCVKFPPAFSREELETLEFVPGKKNLVLYGPVGTGKTHMAIAAGVKACNLGYKTKFYTVTELVLKLAETREKTGRWSAFCGISAALTCSYWMNGDMYLWIRTAPSCCSVSYLTAMRARA